MFRLFTAVAGFMALTGAAIAEPAYVETDRTPAGSVVFVDLNSLRPSAGATLADVLLVTPDNDDPRYATIQVSANCGTGRMTLLGGTDYRMDGRRLGELADEGPSDVNNPFLGDMICGRASGSQARETFATVRAAIDSIQGTASAAADDAERAADDAERAAADAERSAGRGDARISHRFLYIGHADWEGGRGAQVFVDLDNMERDGDEIRYWSLWIYDRPFRGEGYRGAAELGIGLVAVRCRSLTYRFETFHDVAGGDEVFSAPAEPQFSPVNPSAASAANDMRELQTACSPPADPPRDRVFRLASEAMQFSRSLAPGGGGKGR